MVKIAYYGLGLVATNTQGVRHWGTEAGAASDTAGGIATDWLQQTDIIRDLATVNNRTISSSEPDESELSVVHCLARKTLQLVLSMSQVYPGGQDSKSKRKLSFSADKDQEEVEDELDCGDTSGPVAASPGDTLPGEMFALDNMMRQSRL